MSKSLRGQIRHVNRHLVKTLDKKALLTYLRDLREQTIIPAEAALLTELAEKVDSGNFDG